MKCLPRGEGKGKQKEKHKTHQPLLGDGKHSTPIIKKNNKAILRNNDTQCVSLSYFENRTELRSIAVAGNINIMG